MEPVGTLTDSTSDGRSYYDEHNDFRLEIPEGAIVEGVSESHHRHWCGSVRPIPVSQRSQTCVSRVLGMRPRM